MKTKKNVITSVCISLVLLLAISLTVLINQNLVYTYYEDYTPTYHSYSVKATSLNFRKEIVIPESTQKSGERPIYKIVKIIEPHAFEKSRATRFVIPDSISVIGMRAFYSETSKTIVYEGTLKQWKSIDFSSVGIFKNAILECEGEIYYLSECGGIYAKYNKEDGSVTIY
ncbi:MAG: hypothetical protein E7634_03970 [Ruminococcaceae bacterium]|nr:hypothetical protein [Oscillospiraceae bacterium]